ncbi:MAG: hypothetical protein FP826_15205 [Sphingomonadales bacterium]|nr:hypothetical protein [Sphingomonadales bacterium]MBU3993825.1 hypothetical protein [Alphaproteobacteria bacterium]
MRSFNVEGAVAELGVYQGDQARLLNALFPDRSLNLFDTFSGFSDRDLGAEQQNNLSSAIVGDFVDASVELVMNKPPHPAMAKVFPGYFPETAAGIDEQFAFVSLDVDLFEPTRAGLHWFYERLSSAVTFLYMITIMCGISGCARQLTGLCRKAGPAASRYLTLRALLLFANSRSGASARRRGTAYNNSAGFAGRTGRATPGSSGTSRR